MCEKIEVKWNVERSFVCVDYPAVVENVDKMLETVGGHETVTKIYKDPTLRLPLRFRPADVFCKPLYGDKANVTRILLKVKRKRSRNSKIEVEMLGSVDRTYKFKSMADFQYLTFVKAEDDSSNKAVYNDIVPTQMHPLSWLKEEAPLFLPPIVFSRMDTPCDYDFRRDVVISGAQNQDSELDDSQRIGHNRKKRCGFAIYVKFEQEQIPAEPHPNCLKQDFDRSFEVGLIEEVKAAFAERPVWSKLALRTKLKCRHMTLGRVLPVVAYYMVTGPWRSLWVRYGYNPRMDPQAKIYQMIDLRLKQFGDTIPLHSKKRGCVHGAVAKASAQVFEKSSLVLKEASSRDQLTEAEVEEKSKYSYYKGVIPSRRQSILQLCDIYLAEVERLVHENDGREEQCDVKEGWLSPGFTSRCRSALLDDIRSSLSSAEQQLDVAAKDSDVSSDDCEEEADFNN